MAPSKMTGKCHNTVIEANGQSRLEVKGLFNLVSAFFLKNAILIQLKFQYSKVWRSIKWTQKHRQHFLMSHYNLSDSRLFFLFFLHVRAGLLIALKITLINFAIFKNKYTIYFIHSLLSLNFESKHIKINSYEGIRMKMGCYF